jgi:type I restriction enzyme S subunit
LRDEDILINSTGTGTAGRVAQLKHVPFPTVVDGHMIVLRPNEKLVPRYLGYALKAHQSEILQLDEGSTGQTELNRERLLSEIIVSYPVSLEKQCAIVDTLSNIDEKITINTEINHNLEQIAQIIFKSWFADFEPFVDGEFIDSELGEIPAGWRVGTLSELITVKYGKDHKKLADGFIPVFGSGGIMRFVDTVLYHGESVLIPRKGTLNNIIYINQPFWSVDTMFYTEMRQPNLTKFVYFFLRSKDLASMNSGSAVPSMTSEVLNALHLVIPPDEELARFEEVVGIQFAQIQDRMRENDTLATLRDTLLPKLMSGELQITAIDDANYDQHTHN